MKALCLVLLSIAMVVMISGQLFSFSVELDNKIIENSVVSRNINVFTSHKINERIGFTAFSLTSKGWSEAYFGPEFYLAKWLSISASLGLETAPKSWRTAASLWVGKSPISVLTIFEKGGGGYWYNISAFYQVDECLQIGILSKRGLGTGPQVKMSIPNTPLQVWGSIGYDTEAKRTKEMVGIIAAY